MRIFILISGFIAAILALLLATLPLYNLAYIPAIVAILIAMVGYYNANQQNKSIRPVSLFLIIASIAILITVYKDAFTKIEVGNTEQLEQREKDAEENAIQELENIDIETELEAN